MVRGALLAAGFAVAMGACGGSNDTNTGAGSGGSCSLNGKTCQNVCSSTLGCVECASNADCGPGQPVCELGRCAECGQSSDCGTGQACYPRDFTCHPACKADADCTDPGQSLCDTHTGACVGCLANTDCSGDRPLCDPARAQCVACLANSDCGVAQPICDVRAGECRECLVDANCQSGFQCAGDHRCHAYCRSNADCGSTHPFCDTQSGECRECLKSADCPTASPICANDGNCVQCQVNADCAADTAHPVCWHTQCAECAQNSDCPNNGKCHGGTCG